MKRLLILLCLLACFSLQSQTTGDVLTFNGRNWRAAAGGGASLPLTWDGTTLFLDRDAPNSVGGLYYPPAAVNPGSNAVTVSTDGVRMFHATLEEAITILSSSVELKAVDTGFVTAYSAGAITFTAGPAYTMVTNASGGLSGIKLSGDTTTITGDATVTGNVSGTTLRVGDQNAQFRLISGQEPDVELWNNDATARGNLAVNNLTADGRIVSTPHDLTDAATIAVDATLGDIFRVTLGGNRTLENPTGASNGQLLEFWVKMDGTGSRTLTLDTKFRIPTSQGGLTISGAPNSISCFTVRYLSSEDIFVLTGQNYGVTP